MDLRRPFAFLAEDPESPRKIGLASLLYLVPVLGFAVTGYQVRLASRVASSEPHPLPELDDVAGLWREGLWLRLAGLTYQAAIGSIVALPLLGAALSIYWTRTDPQSSLPLASILLLTEAAVLLATLLGTGLSLLWPGIVALYVHEPSYRTCFQLGQVVRLMALYPSAYLTLWGIPVLLAIAAAAVLLPLLALLAMIPCLGATASLVLGVAAAVAILLISAHLEGQFVYLAGLEKHPQTPAFEGTLP